MPPSSLLSLPPELLTQVVSSLRGRDLSAARLASRSLAAAADRPGVWRERTVALSGVGRVNRRGWKTFRARRLTSVHLSPPHTNTQGVLSTLLRHLPSLQHLSCTCSVLHAAATTTTPRPHSLATLTVTMDTTHFNSHRCKCTAVLSSGWFPSLTAVHVVVKVPLEETLSLAWFTDLADALNGKLRSVLVLLLPPPPPRLASSFSPRLAPSALSSLLPVVRDTLADRGVTVTARQR